jgi:hypothetical protein
MFYWKKVKNVQSEEWNKVLEEFEDIGYCCFTLGKT